MWLPSLQSRALSDQSSALTQFSKAEARQTFPFGQMRSCRAQILGKQFPLHKTCLCPFEDLGFRQLAFSTPRKPPTEQGFRGNRFKPPFHPLYRCDAIALFPQTAFSLGQRARGPAGAVLFSSVPVPRACDCSFPTEISLQELNESFMLPFSLLMSIAVVARKEKYLASER